MWDVGCRKSRGCDTHRSVKIPKAWRDWPMVAAAVGTSTEPTWAVRMSWTASPTLEPRGTAAIDDGVKAAIAKNDAKIAKLLAMVVTPA